MCPPTKQLFGSFQPQLLQPLAHKDHSVVSTSPVSQHVEEPASCGGLQSTLKFIVGEERLQGQALFKPVQQLPEITPEAETSMLSYLRQLEERYCPNPGAPAPAPASPEPVAAPIVEDSPVLDSTPAAFALDDTDASVAFDSHMPELLPEAHLPSIQHTPEEQEFFYPDAGEAFDHSEFGDPNKSFMHPDPNSLMSPMNPFAVSSATPKLVECEQLMDPLNMQSISDSPPGPMSTQPRSLKRAREVDMNPIDEPPLQRPKLQCSGRHQKSRLRCKNMALLPHNGVQPTHCAEHIHLEPNPVYHKCGALMLNEKSGRYKMCKETIVSDFPRCHKHVEDWLKQRAHMPGAFEEAVALRDAAMDYVHSMRAGMDAARAHFSDEYQRRCKMLPKCTRMAQVVDEHVAEMQAMHQQQQQQQFMFAPQQDVAPMWMNQPLL